VKLDRSMCVFFGSISLAMVFYQDSVVSFHPRFLLAREVLLM
jgi:hypothetical protein